MQCVLFTFGAVLARFRFHCNPNYVMCVHKTTNNGFYTGNNS